jgi:multidrug efflux pump subunit AcrA (membrane-fusion protein)
MRDLRRSLLPMIGMLGVTTGCPELAAEDPPLGDVHTLTHELEAPRQDVFEAKDRWPGVMLSTRRLEVRAPVSATIVEIALDHGDLVREGDVIAILDSGEAEAELAVADAELRALERERSSARVVSTVKRRRRDVAEALHGDGYAAADAVESARLDVDQAAAEVDLIDARVQALEARIARLRILVDERQLRSPMTGVVAGRMVDAGAFVSTSTTIVRLVSEHADRVRFAVDPEDRSAWKRGQRVEVWSTESVRLSGAVVHSIAPEVDPATNHVFVDAALDEPDALPLGLAVWVHPTGIDP